ncbi:ROK family transcriptional regulator [Lederbergia wuyishanensis]|uniref:NBD/HSP70 family sugar kinase n=1 Tax=Lederbergia wuyishanensis TaxID=1347903 RepID=A0ABU0D3V6_9BACI|nr:ROK family transcriptional regulator [Lederbergia wuyishanensis]MCJ8007789.1 ROK family transcriptional regulator [Lederbergia wuyishanensis]MDQ0343048.1 putative NBD/HSP70 family sugar kinase [Lederbergia wuyishanensis]
MKIRGNQQMLREINKSLLLNLIYLHAPISRVELARLTKLSPTTVSVLVEEIINEGLIHETGTTGSGVGRKMTMLEINAENGYVIGIDLSRESSLIILLNLRGELIRTEKMECFIGEQSLREKLPLAIDDFINQQNIDRKMIKWIGLAVPGIIDEEQKTIIGSKYLQVRNFPLKDYLNKSFNIPIYIVNDIEAAGFAERFSGAAKGKSTIVYILIDYGIGAGFVINNQIYRGAASRAGKIGDFYPYGIDTLYERLKEEYPEVNIESDKEATIQKFVSLALDGIEPYEHDLNEMIKQIAKYCGNVIQLLNPEQLIVSGWIASNEKLAHRITDLIHEYEDNPNNPTPVNTSFWKNDGPAIGAATIGLHQMFRTKTVR